MSSLPTVGPYQLLQELGRGKQSVVYKAWQTSVGRPVALKTLRKHDLEALRKFQAEARLSANLKIPGVRSIYEAGQTPDGYTFVVMEYVERSLKGVMRERLDRRVFFTRQEVGHLLMPIARALDDIHSEDLVHLDIKPANILISKDGYAVLADFGIARRRGEQTFEGTPLYMSPEQAAGNKPVGPWSDIYSLGVLIYEMTAGRPPFVSDLDLVLVRQHVQDQPPSPRQFNPRLGRDLEQALLTALSKNPRLRPPTATDLLRQACGLRPTPTPQVRRRINSLPIILIIIATVLIVLIPVLLLAFGMILSQPIAMPTRSPAPKSPEPQNDPVCQGTTVRSFWEGDIQHDEAFVVRSRQAKVGQASVSNKLATTFRTTELSFQDLSEPARPFATRPAQGREFYGRTRTSEQANAPDPNNCGQVDACWPGT